MLVAAVFVAGFLMGRNRTERHCGANLTWKYENNMLYINGEGDMWDYDANSPWHNLRKRIKAIEMHGVESIGDSAFLDLDLLTNITIPYGVTSIGNEAFKRCVSLESIVIPDSVTSISYWAFNDCDSLKTIYFTGTEAQWNALGLSQNDINNATVTFAE